MIKPMSAAEYAAHTEKKKAEQEVTEIVTLKSGSIFQLRKIDLKGMVQLGLIPQQLVAESIKAQRLKGSYTPPQTAEIQIDGLILKREVVTACCVMPPFNEETAKAFLPEDFEEIYEWAMSHQGEQADALLKSGKGRTRRTSRNRTDGKELRPTVESSAAN